ncbi:helix-turn-helix domain-containing protein [Flavitalea antarctica]
MQTSTTNGRYNFMHIKRELLCKGHFGIQFYSSNQQKKSTYYLEQNILLLVTKGKLGITYGIETFEVNNREIAFIKKNMILTFHRVADTTDDRLEYFVFVLEDEIIKEFIKLSNIVITHNEASSPILINVPNRQILKYVETLESFCHEPESIKSSLVKIKLLELLFYLSSLDNSIVHGLYNLRKEFRTDITVTVEENIMNSVSLQQLAVLTGRSLSSFRRDFLAIYNMCPSDYIRKKRLEKAQELLRCTTMTITDICYTLGFENIAHFSRLFKSYFQHSPSEFRQRATIVQE